MGTSRAATAAPEPLLDPPGVRSARQGFRVGDVPRAQGSTTLEGGEGLHQTLQNPLRHRCNASAALDVLEFAALSFERGAADVVSLTRSAHAIARQCVREDRDLLIVDVASVLVAIERKAGFQP